LSSLHRRIASRLRFRDYIKQHRTGSRPASTAPSELPPVQHRSLTRLYAELYQLLIGYRLTIALSLLGSSVGTLLKLVPPFASKVVIDYIIPGHPLPAAVVAWSPISIPESPKASLVALVGLVLIVSVVGKLLGLSTRWYTTRTTKRVQVAVRRKVYEHAMRLPLHRVYQLKSGGGFKPVA
jgi:ATP-binding cassette, subfamily B, bacterial